MRVITRFDITATNTRGNFNANRLPYQDQAGQLIDSELTWHHSRNQQRNWDTVNQLISLRALPQAITEPVRAAADPGRIWRFEFELENAGAFEQAGDPVGALKTDSEGVPMIQGLAADPGIGSHLQVGTNIWFEPVTINKS